MKTELFTAALGWFSSVVLVLTLLVQVRKQWAEQSSQGVSKWLFIGQIIAQVGFTFYSYLVNNWVFVVTNSILLFISFLGLAIVIRHRGFKNIFGVSS